MVALSDRKIEIVRTLVQSAPDKIVGGLRAALREAGGDTVLASVRQLVEVEAEDRALRNTIFAPLAAMCVGDGKPADGLTFPAPVLGLLWRGLKAAAPEEMAAAELAAAELAAALAAIGPNKRIPDPTPAYNAAVQAAAAALRAGEQRDFRAAAELSDAARPGGAATLATCLDITPIVRRALPKLNDWITHTGGEVGAAARLAYKDAAAIAPESGPVFFEMLAAQLDPPWLVLRIISAVMDKPNERYLGDSELGAFPERVLAAIDEALKDVARMDLYGGAKVGREAARRAELVTRQVFELETCIELSREHGWGHRVMAQKKSLASLVEGKLKESEKLIAAALPESSGFRGRRGGPKVDEAPDLRAVGRATTMLHFVHEVRSCANYGGFSATHAKVSERLGQAVEGYVELVLDHVRTGDVPDVGLAHEHLKVAADFAGLVRDEKAADLVRRRAASACAAPEPPAAAGPAGLEA